MKRLLLLLTLLLPAIVQANDDAPVSHERLHYRLAYSGLITTYVWKELADFTMELEPLPTHFRGQHARRVAFELDTSYYPFAELIHSVRYRWESILSPDLSRTLLVRIVDSGDSDMEEVAWYDWPKQQINLYRKREKVEEVVNYFEEEPRRVWEKDKFGPPPPFIDPHPPLGEGLSYLMQSKRVSNTLARPAIDPLTMLLHLRRHNFEQTPEQALTLLLDDELEHYRARLLAHETLKRGSCTDPAIKVEVTRADQEGEEGVMHLWLSDDAQRLPLRIDIDAPLGMLHVQLQRVSQPARDNTLCPGATS